MTILAKKNKVSIAEAATRSTFSLHVILNLYPYRYSINVRHCSSELDKKKLVQMCFDHTFM